MKSQFYRASLLGLALLASGCEKPRVDLSALEARLSDIEDSVRKDKQATARLRDELDVTQKRTEDSQAEVEAAMLAATDIKKSLVELKASFAGYRDQYRAWIQLHGPGMKLADISANGKTFHNVVVKSVNGYELAFLHEGGVARIALADAPQALRDKFAYVAGTTKPAPSLPIGALANAPIGLGGAAPAMPADPAAAQAAGLPAASAAASDGSSGDGSESSGSTGTRKFMTLAGGQVVEVIAEFSNGGGAGAGGGGTKVKGYTKDQLPPGYKPIGSGFSGSSLGKDSEKKSKN